MKRSVLPLLAFILLLLAGCGGGNNQGGGSAVVTLPSPAGNPNASPTATPRPFVRTLTVTPSNAVLGQGASQQLQVSALYADGTRHNVTTLSKWSSSAPAVATVSATGLLTAAAAGNATVSATFLGVTASAKVQVVSGQLVRVTVQPTNATIIDGATQQFKASADFSNGQTIDVTTLVTWTSGNPQVATISNASQNHGQAQGRNVGTTTITATFGAFSATATLQVTNATVTSVQVTPATATGQIGNTRAFTATAVLSDGRRNDVTTTATWTSSNPAVATVNASGVATGVSAGSAQLSAAFGGQTGNATLTVSAATLNAITVLPANATLAFGTDEQYTAVGQYSDGTTADITARVTWTTSNAAVATVTATGLVKGVAAGTATITATLGAIAGSTSVTIAAPALVSIAITPADDTSIPTGTQRAYHAQGTFADGSTGDVTDSVTWSSSNATVASVSNTAGSRGVVSGNVNGRASISATEGSVSSTVRTRIMLYGYGTDGGTIRGYSLDPNSGAPTPVTTATPPDTACICAVAVDPSNRFLYAIDGQMNMIYSLTIDGATGGLTLQGGPVATGEFPNGIAVSPDSRYVYVSDGNDGSISGYSANTTTGALTPLPFPATPAGLTPNTPVFDNNSHLYVADASGNAVYGYTWNASNGALTPLTGSPWSSGNFPVSPVVSNTGNFLYVSNASDGTIGAYRIAVSGALTPLATTQASGALSMISASPLSPALYGTDVPDSLIDGFAISAIGGLTPAPGLPISGAGQLPAGVAIDPASRFLYVTFLIDAQLGGYRIDPTSGALTQLPWAPFPLDIPFELFTTTH